MQYRSITFWRTNFVVRDVLLVSIVLLLFKKHFIAMKLHHYYINPVSGQFNVLRISNTCSLCHPINALTCYSKVYISNLCTYFLVSMRVTCVAHFIIRNLSGVIVPSNEYLEASRCVFSFSSFLFDHYRALKILRRTCLKFGLFFSFRVRARLCIWQVKM